MKELSIFIDESGDFSQTVNQSPYYIVTLLFHDQSDDITENITRLKQWLLDASINDEYIHTHPIIRKEDPYHNLSIDERRKILNKMLRFTMGCPIKYFNIIVNKRECKDKHSLSAIIDLFDHLCQLHRGHLPVIRHDQDLMNRTRQDEIILADDLSDLFLHSRIEER